MNKVIKRIENHEVCGQKFFDIIVKEKDVTWNLKANKTKEWEIIDGVGRSIEKFSRIDKQIVQTSTAFRFSKTKDGFRCNLKTVKGQIVFGNLKEVSNQKRFAEQRGNEDWKVSPFLPKTLTKQFREILEVAETKLKQI
tara:strand:+ start:5104 stop:5520 length:417 start_codon:yes stop_codon:yes gene_type:complete